MLSGTYNKFVILLTDSACFSACIYLSKVLASMPNTLLIGNGVSDTKYSGNGVHFTLTSGKASLTLPQVYAEVLNEPLRNVISQSVQPDFELNMDIMNSSDGRLSVILALI